LFGCFSIISIAATLSKLKWVNKMAIRLEAFRFMDVKKEQKIMQETENKPMMRSKSKLAMVVGILVLAGAIGFLVYLSQPRAEVAKNPSADAPKRTKHSIGVYSRYQSEGLAPKGANEKSSVNPTDNADDKTVQKSEPSVPVEVLRGETTNDTTADSSPTQSAAESSKQAARHVPEKQQAERQIADKQIVEKTTKTAPAHHRKHRHEETFFELAPNSGKHAPDNLDRVAN
jgi:hypothetical protein